jgi:uncharacterized membrane protein YuzA (DUF378 family)
MRVLFRLISGFSFFTVIGTLLLVLGMWLRGGIPFLAHSGALGALTIAGWLITLIVGPPAVVLLWKQKNLGRIASAILWASIGLYDLAGVAFFRGPGALVGRISYQIIGCTGLVIFLLSPKARRACQDPSSSNNDVEPVERRNTQSQVAPDSGAAWD